jgi:hypothetical protein
MHYSLLSTLSRGYVGIIAGSLASCCLLIWFVLLEIWLSLCTDFGVWIKRNQTHDLTLPHWSLGRRFKQMLLWGHHLVTFSRTQVLLMGYRIGMWTVARALCVSLWRTLKFLHTVERALLYYHKGLIPGQAWDKLSPIGLNWRPCMMW